jgi:hypothetical protein
MKVVWFKAVVLIGQMILVFLAQDLFSLMDISEWKTRHPPLDGCAIHKCGCDPVAQKANACCCQPGHGQPAKAEQTAASAWEQFLRAAHCDGSSGPNSAPSQPFEYAIVPSNKFINAVPCLQAVIFSRTRPALFRIEPPDPPPRFDPLA